MRTKIIPAALMLASLSACKVGIAPQIFTSDVLAALDSGSSVAASTVLEIDTTSDDNCTKHSAAIAEALKQGFAEATFLECARTDMTAVARYRVAVPMGAKGTMSGSALGIEITEGMGTIAAIMRRNPEKVDQIFKALPDDLTTFADENHEPSISVTLQNDLAGPVDITMQGAFIDGQPYQLPETFSIERRAELKITLSSVGNAVLMSENASNGSLLFFMARPK